MTLSVEEQNLQKARDAADWVYDPVAANKHASRVARLNNLPPHWVRCDFMRNGERCMKSEGHEKGIGDNAKHEAAK